MDKLAGVFCASWTPTDASGEILWEAFDEHLDWLLQNGLHGVMALGSTGEFIHLTVAQRKAILDRTVQVCNRHSGTRVIANVSDASIRRVKELAAHALEAGAASIAVLPPWYYPMRDADLAEFFISVARGCELPLLLYNYPEVSGKKIPIDIIREVASQVPVIAVKQSGGEFAYHKDLVQLGAELGFSVLSGADTRFEEVLKLGCSGTISGLANAVPEALGRIYENFKSGISSPSEAQLISSLAEAIKDLAFPLNVKATVAGRGFETGEPKNPISASTRKCYTDAVERVRALFPAR